MTASHKLECVAMVTILDDFSPETLVRAIEENAIEGETTLAQWPRMELRDEPDMLWTISDVPFRHFQ